MVPSASQQHWPALRSVEHWVSQLSWAQVWLLLSLVRLLSACALAWCLSVLFADAGARGGMEDLDADPASVIEASFSEIPVVQASSSKILVDEHSEWRCFISSENPDEEKEKLQCALYTCVFPP